MENPANYGMFNLIFNRLKESGLYESGATIEYNGETRFYMNGSWWEPSYSVLIKDVPHLTIEDIFPSNPDQE